MHGLGLNREDDAIIASVIGLAHAFDIVVVAEGVETRAQADLLRGMGCDVGQGYFWSRAVPPAELPSNLRYAADSLGLTTRHVSSSGASGER